MSQCKRGQHHVQLQTFHHKCLDAVTCAGIGEVTLLLLISEQSKPIVSNMAKNLSKRVVMPVQALGSLLCWG